MRRPGTGCAAVLAVGGAVPARLDPAAARAWPLRGPPARGAAGSRAARAAAAARAGRLRGAAEEPVASAEGPGVLAGAALTAALLAAGGAGSARGGAGGRACGAPRAAASRCRGRRPGGVLAQREGQRCPGLAAGGGVSGCGSARLPERAPGDHGSMLLSAAADVAEGLKHRILDRRVRKAEGSRERAAALSAKLERIARLQRGQGGSPGGGARKTSRSAAGLQRASGASPGSLPARAAARLSRAPSEAEIAAPSARMEAQGILGMALQRLARACRAIFAGAPGAAAAAAEPLRELLGGLEGGLARAGEALLGKPAPAAQRPHTLHGRKEHRREQRARTQAIEDRHARLVELHGACVEQLRSF
ncbi:unnamed protein product [Prorocentrum cordatum]|uniref:Uncharacterized protein n=1 Tax=Prorocentrum cordatum TaxID=2364126 RepID=A0ABN9XLK5_9DINO|nr:unnamed protein product [Polarella glacialis]